ncbi:type III PLP-dependent enzyme [Primorskyibacter aestuariivivens]|uniref:type III PLP-dependent enzyme n=1 Tax=Primorskyibacter aestuariivivens TaxID=1888912 RepID=UPI0023000324|nr:type III PLP-dependent enzyme [Primorskyibacter aestuariivivens]MDA7427809.1 type III PLP-dependent enzyme [Primorskyibacter aestuariivivens]
MQADTTLFATSLDAAMRLQPTEPVACFAPCDLLRQYERFRSGFDGLVTYAVKANASPMVLENLCGFGMRAFDVASPKEMRAVREVCPGADLHYHNPIRGTDEIAEARHLGVRSWSVDDPGELAKIAPAPGDEIAVRLALNVPGAAYDFGEKFGVGPAETIELLQQVQRSGATPSLTFHPGTQCRAPEAWERYIITAAQIARDAGVTLARLNLGGGFASDRDGAGDGLEQTLSAIGRSARSAFEHPPELVCEPGRALVAEAFTLVTRIKARRGTGAVYLNDGLYGGLAEMRDMPTPRRVRVFAPDGAERLGPPEQMPVFGPTCDSVDRLPPETSLPGDCREGDFVLFSGMGAYSLALSTGFNGFGLNRIATVRAGLAPVTVDARPIPANLRGHSSEASHDI